VSAPDGSLGTLQEIDEYEGLVRVEHRETDVGSAWTLRGGHWRLPAVPALRMLAMTSRSMRRRFLRAVHAVRRARRGRGRAWRRGWFRAGAGWHSENRTRKRYDHYLAKGYGIGSGAIESAHKQFTHARMRQAGMRWSEPGARHMLALRDLLLNREGSLLDRLVTVPLTPGEWSGAGDVSGTL